MRFLLFLFLFIIIFLSYCSKKYHNPYTLTFLFGKKGAGKTCWMVALMIKYLKRGYHVYTDMQDIRLEGVRIVHSKDFATFRPEPNSAIFLDEVGISMDSRNFKSFPPGLRDFFKFVRKQKCIVYMNSQSWDVDKKVRDTTDSLALINSFCGCISFYRPIVNRVVLVDSTAAADSRIAVNLAFSWLFSWRFLWLPRYFKYFDTTEMPYRDFVPYASPTNPVPYKFTIFDYLEEFAHVFKSKLSDFIRTRY